MAEIDRLPSCSAVRGLTANGEADRTAVVEAGQSVCRSSRRVPVTSSCPRQAACSLCVQLSDVLAEHIEPHCAMLARALLPALAHQHSRVRTAAVEARPSASHEPSECSQIVRRSLP